MSAYQPVLDPACGGRMFWFDKSDDRVLFGDVRDESWELCDGRRFDVKPDMLMDYRDLPFPDGTFRMVVLDPPHLRNAGETSYMAQKYGCLDQETWKADLKTMFSECFRVLKEHGVLIFKWNETQIPVSQILKLTAHKPLFGNKQPNRTGNTLDCLHEGGREMNKRYKVCPLFWSDYGDERTLMNMGVFEKLLNEGWQILRVDTMPTTELRDNAVTATNVYILEREANDD